MDAALIFTWTHIFPGREKLALEFATESDEYWEKKATDGRCTTQSWFLSSSAPFHFTMVKGEMTYLRDLLGTDEFIRMMNKGALLLGGFHYYLYFTDAMRDKSMEQWIGVGEEMSLI